MKQHNQLSLFNSGGIPKFPRGFSFWQDFISKEQEKELLVAISKIELSNVAMHGVVAKRRVAQFGVQYSYATKQLSTAPPIPFFLLPPRDQFAERLGSSAEDLPQAIINEYTIGAAIGWHIDGPAYEVIAGFSIGGDCTFKLRPIAQDPPKKNKKEGIISFIQPARSAYIMSGEARWHWQHSIAPTKSLRYSVTYRSLKK